MEANKTVTPIDLPVRVNGSETTTAIWIEDANGKRVITIKGGERDADIAAFFVRAGNEFDARGAALQVMTAKAERLESVNAELVKALQRAKDWIEGAMDDKGWSTERVKNPPEGSHLHAINAALAKAGAA